ncbi:hypothetical protein LL253_14300 [Sphingobium soli]|uniref:Transposase n=1 Tax=Sphingobium soli TaxID=1591116 RepID=A0ABS8H870_9SPHN|nr:hypothetical protein [Sphingobium soli]MCC4233852.1 hypothetical protein [Sphingobium soli]
MARAAPSVRDRFETKVIALEAMFAAGVLPDASIPRNPSELRRWAGVCVVGQQEFVVVAWSSPNDYYSSSNHLLRARFEAIIRKFNGQKAKNSNALNSALAAQIINIMADLEREQQAHVITKQKLENKKRDYAELLKNTQNVVGMKSV